MSETVTITVRLPCGLLDVMRAAAQTDMTDEALVKLYLAIGLFVVGSISSGKAAETAGMHRPDFEGVINRLGVPAYQYSMEEYKQDLEAIRSLIR